MFLCHLCLVASYRCLVYWEWLLAPLHPLNAPKTPKTPNYQCMGLGVTIKHFTNHSCVLIHEWSNTNSHINSFRASPEWDSSFSKEDDQITRLERKLVPTSGALASYSNNIIFYHQTYSYVPHPKMVCRKIVFCSNPHLPSDGWKLLWSLRCAPTHNLLSTTLHTVGPILGHFRASPRFDWLKVLSKISNLWLFQSFSITGQICVRNTFL